MGLSQHWPFLLWATSTIQCWDVGGFTMYIYIYVQWSKLPLFSNGMDGHQPNSRVLYANHKDYRITYLRWDDESMFNWCMFY